MKVQILAIAVFINFILLTFNLLAQNVGINQTGAAPHSSALLDLNSTDKGFLITRVDTANIVSPAFGLMTLAPSDSCLYLYNGINWMGMGGGGNNCICNSNNFACNVPPLAGAITGITTHCPSLTGQIYSISAVPGASTYTWTVPTGWTITSGQGTTSITVTTGLLGQNGNITVTSTNNCGTSAQRTLAVNLLEIIGIRAKIGMYGGSAPAQNSVTLTFNQAYTGWTDMSCDNCYTCSGTGDNLIMTYSGSGACVAYNGMWRDYTFTTFPTSVNISMVGTGVHSYETNFYWLYSDGSISSQISTCNNTSPYYYTNWNESYSCSFSPVPNPCP
jgi:hypothetical protein